ERQQVDRSLGQPQRGSHRWQNKCGFRRPQTLASRSEPDRQDCLTFPSTFFLRLRDGTRQAKGYIRLNESITATPAVTEEKFVRGLGLLDSTMLVAGSMIGSGIFIVSAIIARQVGAPGWLLVVWLVTGLLTLM